MYPSEWKVHIYIDFTLTNMSVLIFLNNFLCYSLSYALFYFNFNGSVTNL